MKLPPALRLVLVVALPCAGFLAAWGVARLRARVPAGEGARPAAPRAQPLSAERRALPPQPVAAPSAPLPEGTDGRAAWVELNNQATTDLTEGDLSAAIEKFERCLAAEPDNQVFAGNLAEALVRLAKVEHERGELDPAIAHLGRAVELGSAREDIQVLREILERWRRERELGIDDWTEGSSRFELSYDTDRADILHHSHEVLEHLEQSYEDLVRWFGADPFAGDPAQRSPIRVVLYDPEDFDRLTGLGDWAAGVFDGVVRVSVQDLVGGQGWRAVLVHELVHAFVQALGGGGVPGWLNEGLAQLLEGRAGAAPRLRELLAGAEALPLERLAGSLAGWEDKGEIARAYAQSLLFVDYLRQNYGDEGLRRMVLGLALGRAPAASFREWTGVALEIAFEDWAGTLER